MIKEISLIALVALGIGSLFLGTSLSPALGQASLNSNGKNGFGVASSDFATSCPPGSVGAHSSSFAGEPREGIGNVAKGNSPPPHGGAVGQLGTTLNALRLNPSVTPNPCSP